MGIPHDSPQRVAEAVELLGVDAVLAEPCLDELAQDEGVVMEYLPSPEGEVTAVYLFGQYYLMLNPAQDAIVTLTSISYYFDREAPLLSLAKGQQG